MEAKLRGPHSFPLERLLHIFWAVFAHHDAEDEGEAEGGGRPNGTDDWREVRRSGEWAASLAWRGVGVARRVWGARRHALHPTVCGHLARPPSPACPCSSKPPTRRHRRVLFAHPRPTPPSPARQARRVMQQGEVLHQVSSLVSLRLLDQCSGDVLEGQLYRQGRAGQGRGAGGGGLVLACAPWCGTVGLVRASLRAIQPTSPRQPKGNPAHRQWSAAHAPPPPAGATWRRAWPRRWQPTCSCGSPTTCGSPDAQARQEPAPAVAGGLAPGASCTVIRQVPNLWNALNRCVTRPLLAIDNTTHVNCSAQSYDTHDASTTRLAAHTDK